MKRLRSTIRSGKTCAIEGNIGDRLPFTIQLAGKYRKCRFLRSNSLSAKNALNRSVVPESFCRGSRGLGIMDSRQKLSRNQVPTSVPGTCPRNFSIQRAGKYEKCLPPSPELRPRNCPVPGIVLRILDTPAQLTLVVVCGTCTHSVC